MKTMTLTSVSIKPIFVHSPQSTTTYVKQYSVSVVVIVTLYKFLCLLKQYLVSLFYLLLLQLQGKSPRKITTRHGSTKRGGFLESTGEVEVLTILAGGTLMTQMKALHHQA